MDFALCMGLSKINYELEVRMKALQMHCSHEGSFHGNTSKLNIACIKQVMDFGSKWDNIKFTC